MTTAQMREAGATAAHCRAAGRLEEAREAQREGLPSRKD